MDMKTFSCNPDLCNLSRNFFSVFSPPFSGSDPKFRYIHFLKAFSSGAVSVYRSFQFCFVYFFFSLLARDSINGVLV